MPLLAALLLGLTLAGGRPPELDVLEVLRRAETKYRNLQSYRAEWVQSSRNVRPGGESAQRQAFRLSYRRPGKLRREALDNSGFGGDFVSDGETSYLIQARLKEYIERPAAPAADSPESGPEPAFLRVVEGAARAVLVREEALPVEGRSPACWVIEVIPGPDPQPRPRVPVPIRSTLWIEQNTYAIWKFDQESELNDPFLGRIRLYLNVVYQRIEFDVDLPDSLFTFTPPADYKQVAQFNMTALLERPAGLLEGQPAPAFTLTNLKGEEVSLESMRGKVVLLNFWATWCEPCRAEMPLLELLYAQFRRQGLEVVGVSDEAAETIAGYWKTNGIPFVALRDPGGKVKEAYSVQALPSTFLIARDGRISFVFTGPLSGRMIKEALQAQQIWLALPE